MKQSKTILYLSIANLLGLFLIGFFLFINPVQVVFVDSNKLINGYLGMIEARKIYEEKSEKWKANVDTLTSEIQKQILTYEKESGSMSSKERQLSQELIKTRQQQLYDYQKAIGSQAREEDNKMTSEVIAQINAYIKDYGEQKGYTIILAATEYGNIAYANNSLDITEEVLAGLNKQYQGK